MACYHHTSQGNLRLWCLQVCMAPDHVSSHQSVFGVLSIVLVTVHVCSYHVSLVIACVSISSVSIMAVWCVDYFNEYYSVFHSKFD